MEEKLDNYCVIIPAYREEAHIGEVVRDVARYAERVVVVDDGSDDATAERAEHGGAAVLRHDVNTGKGGAIETGLTYAVGQGFEFIIMMDGDGQHAAADIPAFLDAHRRFGSRVVVGNRMANPGGMPFVRRLTNRFMSALLSRHMGQRVPDTQNGFRLFHRDVFPYLTTDSGGFAAESEVLLRLADAGVRIDSVPTRVIYCDEKSKIRPIRDTIVFFRMLGRHRRAQRTAKKASRTAESQR